MGTDPIWDDLMNAMVKDDGQHPKYVRRFPMPDNPIPQVGPRDSITDLISERGKTHGDFFFTADCSQQLKLVCERCMDSPLSKQAPMNNIQKEALDMILSKIGRIIAGDPGFKDHWDDIAGYAKLVAERCE